MPKTVACPSCGKEVSRKAYDCPHCGHPLRKPRRGLFGTIFKGLLIVFNIVMLLWLIGYIGVLSDMNAGLTDEAERAGAFVGGTIGMGMLLALWAMGDVVLGLLVLLTRPSK
ncbi:zinc-ribbon domain-containing protein [Rhodovulum sp. ES.010]|uniref:zinc-ribbon domain-containing protein n=1 Tax=Rhodovulum sp. ES.010 TaxID=1882821 RepID=UPI000925CBF8|nr:zinc-ribbon domain-containing protein [Rhodovulum sp. ES.010]SIO36920.1 zinc-ribbon domain-containing protein [Rhodovulum sp. ES.010]